jgi:hypothetical protein
MTKTYHDVLDSAAGLRIPDNLNLFPNVSAQLSQRKTFMQTMRARPALAILVAVLAFLLLTGIAYAIGRSLGYIPGVGIVEQGTPIRVLAQPVSVTRDGITLTITSAVLTMDRTVIEFTVENVPWEALSHDENVVGCSSHAEIKLPDGTNSQFFEGGGGAGKNRFVFSPVPADTNDATFIMPCISGTLPGKAPENWELHLRFAPAPPEMTVVPVIEIQPSQTPEASPSSVEESPLSITKVMEIGDNYIIMGEFDAEKTKAPLHAEARWQWTDGIKITDGTGKEIYYTVPNDIELPSPTPPNAEVWAYQISKAFSPPLTISYSGIYITNVGTPQRFELDFDTGENPSSGQMWTLNKDFTMDGYSIRLVSISVGDSGYTFTFDHTTPVNLFEENANVLGVDDVDIAGYTAVGGGGGGGSISRVYEKLPTGKLKISISIQHLQSLNRKSWQVQWTPETPVPSPYGITLKLDKFIPLDDGYYLIGHTDWTDERIVNVSPAGWNLKAYDANGVEVPLEPVVFDKDMDLVQSLAQGQWAFHIYSKAFHAPITLRATQMRLEFKQPVKLTLDLRPYNFSFSKDQIGIPWKFGLTPLDIPGIQASAFKATYIKEGDLRGFEIGIQADTVLRGIEFTIESGLDTKGLSSISSGGGWIRDETTGLIQSRVLTNAKMAFPLVLSANGAAINGDWQVTWDPPAAEAGATPIPMQQACVTLEKWKQAARSSEPIPVDLSQKVLVSRGALWPDPSLFISDLNGSSDERGLVFGQGRLSPDYTKLVYSGTDGNLYLMNVATKESVALTTGGNDRNPFWSADGSQIAFVRYTDKGTNIFVMDNNGQNAHALTDTTDNITLFGWMPGSRSLIFSQTPQDGSHIQTLDINSGITQDLMVLHDEPSESVSFSPDGKWVAFADKVTGRMTPGIFISRLDGSEKRLLVQLDYWVADRPRWSPDGNWLAFEVIDMDRMTSPPVSALVNVETCQVVPLNMLNGTIEQWLDK